MRIRKHGEVGNPAYGCRAYKEWIKLWVQNSKPLLLSAVLCCSSTQRYRAPGSKIREGPQPSQGTVNGLCSSGPLGGAGSGEASTSGLKVQVSLPQLWISESKSLAPPPPPKKERKNINNSGLVTLFYLHLSLLLYGPPQQPPPSQDECSSVSGFLNLSTFDVWDWIILCCAL